MLDLSRIEHNLALRNDSQFKFHRAVSRFTSRGFQVIKLNFLLLVGSLLFCQVVFGHETHGARSPANANKPHTHAQGVFYHDVNGNRKRDPDEKGIPGIKVSNGTEIATTNADGKYKPCIRRYDCVRDQATWLDDTDQRGQTSSVLLHPQAGWFTCSEIRWRSTDRSTPGIDRLSVNTAKRTGSIQGPAVWRYTTSQRPGSRVHGT